MHAKDFYVSAMRSLGTAAKATGILGALEKRRERRYALWLRSLFAIYDIDQLIELDLPWWTFDSIDLMQGFLASRKEPRIFEYGSGASSIWLAKRCAQIVSVEHDAGWRPIVADRLKAHGNSELLFVPPGPRISGSPFTSQKPGWTDYDFGGYVRSIEDYSDTFDMIVVDGRCRNECLKAALPRLAHDGVLLFDNSGRGRYRENLENVALHRTRTSGLTPCLPYPEKTDIFSRNPQVLNDIAALPAG
jgi:hypothetical protein